MSKCVTCGNEYEYTMFGDATTTRCARCTQAARIEDATRAQTRAIEDAARQQAEAAREAAWEAERAAGNLAAASARAQATAASQVREAERNARAAEAALERERAARAIEARASAARATKCPWCGTSEKHGAVADCVDAEEAIEKLGEILNGGDAWDDGVWASVAGELERLILLLHEPVSEQASPYPYCSKRCRQDARSASDDDTTACVKLGARRSALHSTVSAAWKQGAEMNARSESIAHQKAHAAREALGILTNALKAEAETKAQLTAARSALTLAKEREAQASTSLASAKNDLAQAIAGLEQAQAAAKSFFGRLGGAEGRAAIAQQAVDGARAWTDEQTAALTRVQRDRASSEATLRALSDGSRTAAAALGARRVILSALGLSDVSQDVQDVVMSCLVGVICPAGTFVMGSPPSDLRRIPDELQHQVTLTRSFTIGTFPVVQALWQAVMGENPSSFVGWRLPVEQVGWNDCVTFCEKLNRRLGLAPATRGDAAMLTSNCFRLPTEAEWEYAARAGQQTLFAGGNEVSEVGWVRENSLNSTFPVGHKRSNAWGVHDMSGNVCERVWDFYGAYPNGAVTDPARVADGVNRVCRGGSFQSDAISARVAMRSVYGPDPRPYIGLRLCRTLT